MRAGTILSLVLFYGLIMLFLIFLIAINAPACELKSPYSNTKNLGLFYVEASTSTSRHWGTAFLVEFNKKRYLLSAAHVCNKSLSLRLVHLDGKEVKVLKEHLIADVCVLSARNIPESYVPFNMIKLTDQADTTEIVAYGFPESNVVATSCLKLREIRTSLLTARLIFDGLLIPGMSGGPMVESTTGKVVGINVAIKLSEFKSLGETLVPIYEILEELDHKGIN